jgi:hypothetical protein
MRGRRPVPPCPRNAPKTAGNLWRKQDRYLIDNSEKQDLQFFNSVEFWGESNRESPPLWALNYEDKRRPAKKEKPACPIVLKLGEKPAL